MERIKFKWFALGMGWILLYELIVLLVVFALFSCEPIRAEIIFDGGPLIDLPELPDLEVNVYVDDQGNETVGVHPKCNGWRDPRNGLCWENPSIEGVYTFSDANQHCIDKGYDWRLPTINELIALIKSCEFLRACEVDDPNCLGVECGTTCYEGCVPYAGLDEDGCYWYEEVNGFCDHGFWSSSRVKDQEEKYWCVNFGIGALVAASSKQYVRCINRRR